MINRLYRLFCGVILFAVSLSAFAQSAPSVKFSNNGNAPFFSTGQEACTAYYSGLRQDQKDYWGLFTYFAPTTCRSAKNGSESTVTQTFYCADGQSITNGMCPPPKAPDCTSKLPYGAFQQWDTIEAARGGALPQAAVGCQITIKSLTSCGQVISTGKYRCDYQVVNTGSPAIATNWQFVPGSPGPDGSQTPGDLNAKTNSPTEKCPVGSVSGGVTADGMTICMGSGTGSKPPAVDPTKTTSPTVTKDNGDGTSTVVNSTTVKNADGSSTTVTTTTNVAADGTKTTSQKANTTANTAGDAGKYDDPKDKDDLCKRNPLLTICKNSSVSGTCAAIACEGDAIQCATLRAAATMQCTQQQDKDDLAASPNKSLGDSLIAGNDPLKAASDANVKGATVDLSNPNLDSSGFASASCFPAKSFTVAGRTVVMDFAVVCEKIQPLRYAVMAMCTLVAYLVISKSVLGA